MNDFCIKAETLALGFNESQVHGNFLQLPIRKAEIALQAAINNIIPSSETVMGMIESSLEKMKQGTATEGDEFIVFEDFSLDVDSIEKIIKRLSELLDVVIAALGTVEVLYLGDLKPHIHPYENVTLFHLAANADPSESKAALRTAIAQAGDNECGVVLINMANVRELQIRTGPIGVRQHIKTLYRFVDTLKSWKELGYHITVKKMEE